MPTNPDQCVVLLVEDEALFAKIARIALERDGHFVLAAEDGEEALTLSRSFSAEIHVLVSDVIMPKMDGIELRERILEERPGIKVLLMSGYMDAPVASCPFLRKPFHISVLRERVRQLLASANGG